MNIETPVFFVDADSFPAPAKNLILKTAIKCGIKVVYVANRNIPFTIQNKNFSMQICGSEKDAADNFIVMNAKNKDIVFTRDIPLAKKLVEKSITVLNDRGTIFTEEIINEKLLQRELTMAVVFKSPYKKFNSYGKKEEEAFATSLEKVLKK